VNAFLAAYPDVGDYEALRKGVLEYLARPVAASTRNIRLRYLNSFFNWCVAQGYLPANPTAGVKRAKEDLTNVRHVPLEEVKKLLAAPDKKSFCGLRDYCIMLVQIDTGVRPGELFQVKVDDQTTVAGNVEQRQAMSQGNAGQRPVYWAKQIWTRTFNIILGELAGEVGEEVREELFARAMIFYLKLPPDNCVLDPETAFALQTAAT
jgi:integrase